MKCRQMFLIVLVWIISAIAVQAQTTVPSGVIYVSSDTTGNLTTYQDLSRNADEKQAARNERLANVNRLDQSNLSNPDERQRLIFSARTQVQVAKEDRKTYRDFLKQSNVGLIKLLPEIKCPENLKEIEINEPCAVAAIFGHGTSFSFRTQNYQFEEISDIKITQGNFVANGLNTLGLMASLGGVELNSVVVEDENIVALNKFIPASKLDEILVQESQINKGLKLGNLTFSKSLLITEKTTYILRSVAYRGTVGKTASVLLQNDKREDILIAFRVVRKENDGSVTLLWKKLQSKTAPKLIK